MQSDPNYLVEQTAVGTRAELFALTWSSRRQPERDRSSQLVRMTSHSSEWAWPFAQRTKAPARARLANSFTSTSPATNPPMCAM